LVPVNTYLLYALHHAVAQGRAAAGTLKHQRDWNTRFRFHPLLNSQPPFVEQALIRRQRPAVIGPRLRLAVVGPLTYLSMIKWC
jgi:hypothetical protein